MGTFWVWLYRVLRKPRSCPWRPVIRGPHRVFGRTPPPAPPAVREIEVEELAVEARERIMRRLEAEYYALTRGHRHE